MSAATTSTVVLPLDELTWDNRFTRDLPGDPEILNHRRQVSAAYSWVEPTPTANPQTVAWSPEVSELLGISPEVAQSEDFAAVFSGNRIPAGAQPFAMAYGGHQFGNWAGQLGDGRAVALGEVLDRHGNHQMLQLKGAGPTPYSRTADGRAVLRSSLREFLCSEAMFHLGVPTTRALSLITTGDQVIRDILYSGNPAPEPGAVVCRVAPSFTRFGTFQLPASRGDLELLTTIARVTIAHSFPHLADLPLEQGLGRMLTEVAERTANLMVDWMRVGFVHGVMNTDNMSITGLTIDYGPYGWLEGFDPMWTPNTTDAQGRRYRYGQQPQVAHWNLVQLANALVPLMPDVGPLQAAVDAYPEAYERGYREMMARRLGWGHPQEGDDELIADLQSVLTSTEIDQVIFFRDLADVSVEPQDTTSDRDALDQALLAPLAQAWYSAGEVVGPVRDALVDWLTRWQKRVRQGGLGDQDRRQMMDSLNPRYVLRNYLAQEAIDAAETGDNGAVIELLDVLRNPYTDQPGQDRFASRRPEWARNRAGCSMLSCSS